MTSVQFICAQEKDAPVILQLRQRIWSTTYRGIYPDSMIDDFDYSWHMEKELRRIQNPSYSVYLITKDHFRIGYLTLKKTDCITLQSLYIAAEYQQQGIGKQAFDFVRQFCLENETNAFICHCVPENTPARAFYEKMAGKIIGEDLNNDESWMNSVIYQFVF